MPLFYHVQRRGVARFKVGKTYTFGAEQNFFARDLFAVEPRVPVAGVGDVPLDAVIKDFFDPDGFNHYKKIGSSGKFRHSPLMVGYGYAEDCR